jgi:hypothetical protein
MTAAKENQALLRDKEMRETIASEKDPITAQLMIFAYNTLISRILSKEQPVASFDLAYFMQIVQEFASDHATLKKILDGKGDELIWMAESE